MTARKNHIFIVDDHPLVRDGLATLINGQDDLIVCGGAEDSAQAIAGIRKTRPDVALIDISLKNESGLELVKNLAGHFPEVALLFSPCTTKVCTGNARCAPVRVATS